MAANRFCIPPRETGPLSPDISMSRPTSHAELHDPASAVHAQGDRRLDYLAKSLGQAWSEILVKALHAWFNLRQAPKSVNAIGMRLTQIERNTGWMPRDQAVLREALTRMVLHQLVTGAMNSVNKAAQAASAKLVARLIDEIADRFTGNAAPATDDPTTRKLRSLQCVVNIDRSRPRRFRTPTTRAHRPARSRTDARAVHGTARRSSQLSVELYRRQQLRGLCPHVDKKSPNDGTQPSRRGSIARDANGW